MKIVHLNTHSHGGAAVVARRLHRTALASGINSSFITKYGSRSSDLPGYRSLHNDRLRELMRAGTSHPGVYTLGKLVERSLQHRNLANRPAGFEIFSPLNRGKRYHDCLDRADPGVVHLHWVAGFVDHSEFFHKNTSRTFVWTLHDMNPFTGGCHHADGCSGYQRGGCRGCPQLAGTIDPDYSARVLANKREALAPLRDDQLVIVSPSRWLLELSQQSPVTARFRHVFIANPSLDSRPAEGPTAFKLRERVPRDKKIVLFVAENLRNPRKGGALLFEAMRRLARREDVQLVGIGRRTDAPADTAIRFTGRITDEATLAGYFSIADVVVNPSAMENAPLNIIEGLTYGAPAVAFDVGGVSELISDECGIVVADQNPAALAHALEESLFRRQWDREAIKRSAARYAPAAVFQQYHGIYQELVGA